MNFERNNFKNHFLLKKGLQKNIKISFNLFRYVNITYQLKKTSLFIFQGTLNS